MSPTILRGLSKQLLSQLPLNKCKMCMERNQCQMRSYHTHGKRITEKSVCYTFKLGQNLENNFSNILREFFVIRDNSLSTNLGVEWSLKANCLAGSWHCHLSWLAKFYWVLGVCIRRTPRMNFRGILFRISKQHSLSYDMIRVRK